MREKPCSIAILTAFVLLAPALWARPVHKPAPAHKTAAVARTDVRAHERLRSEGATRPRTERVRGHVADGLRPEARAADLAAAPVQPEIHVHHDRKIHLSAVTETQQTSSAAAPETPLAQAGAERRVATVQDFMSPLPAPDAAPVPAAAPAAESRPVKVAVTDAAAPGVTVMHRPKSVVVKTPEEKLAAAPHPSPLPQIPVVQPVLFTRRGRLIVPPALKGSHEILVHQNTMADQEGLDRIRDDEDLQEMRGEKLLVAIPAGPGLAVDERLPLNRRYCRPWTATFLEALARAHYARFHSALQVNSAVRTVEFQERLRSTNGNAAPAEGATASPHLTGQAVDVAKHGLSMTEIAWMRAYLTPLVQEGKVDVEEEFQQACFHISVYKKYLPQAAPKRVIAGRRSGATALAAAVR